MAMAVNATELYVSACRCAVLMSGRDEGERQEEEQQQVPVRRDDDDDDGGGGGEKEEEETTREDDDRRRRRRRREEERDEEMASRRGYEADLRTLLPYLRQSLSCAVCGSLLKDPVGPGRSVCQHFVCRRCAGQKMQMKPACSWCKDYGAFVENEQLRVLLACYKKLCEFISGCDVVGNVAEENMFPFSLNILLEEGITLVQDEDKSRVPCCTEKAMKIIRRLTPLQVVQVQTAQRSVTSNQPVDIAERSVKIGKKTFRSVTKRKILKRCLPQTSKDACGVEATEHQNIIQPTTEGLPLLHKKSSDERLCTSVLKKTTDNKHSSVTERLKNMVSTYNAKYRKIKKLRGFQECVSSVKSVCKKPKGKTGCKCGRAPCTTSVLTCRGQRCPCYANRKACQDCICCGCNNSYMENGRKKLESFAVPEMAHKQSRLQKNVSGASPSASTKHCGQE
ncbi:E3 ubiquitin-protein ligase MSL2-like [Callorhinchus milii]|uniref:E3 ubiquitin-protein ligase MSL2-like n=1 Tax=Callorhinchus milii TaxID=7868 RepID=UPI001C3FDB21|nr:E3 ubiquitin-protein ligase MSL2-like [Callorhinchus milii]